MENKVFVFLKSQNVKGVSKNTGNEYELRKISFADPQTFENHQLDYADTLNPSYLVKGDQFKLKLQLEQGFAGRDSKVIVTDLIPVK